MGVRSGTTFHIFSIAIFFALAAFPPVFHGIGRDMLANSDMDIVSVYQALMINAGQPMAPNPHTGYAYNVAMAGWLHLFSWFGLVPVVGIDGLLVASDFDTVLSELIVAGRWLSVFLAWLLVVLVYAGVYLLHRNRGHAFLLGVLFAIGGGGLASQSVMLRTELSSMLPLFAAAVLLIAAPRVSYGRALAILVVVGSCVHVALMAKVQGVFVAMFLPLFPIVFGWGIERGRVEKPSRNLVIGVLIAAAVTTVPVLAIFQQSLAEESFGIYQLVIAAYVLACALAYGRLYLGSAAHGVLGVSAVAIGFSSAYALNAVSVHSWTTFAIVNLIEHLAIQVPELVENLSVQSRTLPSIARAVASGVSGSEIDRFFSERLRNFDYPFMVLYLAVPAAALALAARRRFDAALKAGFLCAMAGLIVAVFWVARGHFIFFYSIYIEAWVILAAAVLLGEFAVLTDSPTSVRSRVERAVPLAICLFVVGLNVSFRLLDPAAANTRPPAAVCVIREETPLIHRRFDEFCSQLDTPTDLR